MGSELAPQLGLDRFQDREEELFVALLLVAGRFLRRLDATCKKWGITDDQYNVLRILRESHPEGEPRYSIAEKLISRAPDVTRLLDRLEAKGLVVRTRSKPDRRRSISTITPEGLSLLEAMVEDIRKVNREATKPLSMEEKERFALLLRRLVPGQERDTS